MIKVVLDTNILISGIFWKGLPQRIVDLASANEIESITTQEILEEVKTALERLDVPLEKIEEIIKDIMSYSRLIAAKKVVVKDLRDFKDVKIIACALSAEVDYIVTGDKDLLVVKEYEGIQIVNPKTFLELIR